MNTETMTTESTTTETVRAWVGCLGCYNNGALNGKWLDADECGDLVAAGLARSGVYFNGSPSELCRRCGADEFWVMDHEGLPESVLSGECSPCEFAEIAAAWETVEEPAMVAAYLSWLGERVTGANVQELAERARDAWTGCESVTEYAESYLEESGLLESVPESLRGYFDVSAFARDLELGGDLFETDRYVFWCH